MSPIRIVTKISIIIFLVEGLIMVGFSIAPPVRHEPLEALIDSVVLVLFGAPPIYFWVIKPFIAERQKMEASLRDSEERFRDLTEGSIQGVLIHVKGKAVFANQGYAVLFGYESPEEILAQDSVLDHVVPSHRDLIRSYQEKRSRGEQAPAVYEFEGLRKDGSLFWLENRVRVVSWRGSPAIQRTVVDISQRKAAERQLKEAHDQLEKRVEERTRHLSREISVRAETEKKLVLAKRTAEAADRVKSEFLANMSHELRTPLNAIIGFSESMKEEVFGPLVNVKYKEYAGDINGAGQHLLGIIGDILDVSMVEYGKLELKDDKVGLATLARTSIVLVKQRAEQGDVRISNMVGKDTPMLMADKQRVKQILVNLLSNAVKFTPEGGEVIISAGLDGDRGLTITVQDTGIGMNEAELELALMKFGRVESTLSGKYEGSGLGLSLVGDLMKAHGGTLEISSKPKQGTTVIVRFPMARVIK